MKVESLDDLPLIASQFSKVSLSEIFDKYFPDHGHWKGISGGKLVEGWLLYILSESDHRLSYVEMWAEQRHEVLSVLLGSKELRSIDFCDDRLGRLLERYSDENKWNAFEQALNKKMLKVYELDVKEKKNELKIIRSDSFNVPQFREKNELFTFGYSKQRRSDQPFCKVMLSSIDPLSMPLAVEVLKGSGPDVNHYLTVIKRVQKSLRKRGNLYVGDSQLGSTLNRVEILKNGDYYLCPLGKKQCSAEKVKKYLGQINRDIKTMSSLFTEEETKRKPVYFDEVIEKIKDEKSGNEWEERRILAYSPDYAEGLIKSFNNRLTEAESLIKVQLEEKRGRRRLKTIEELKERVEVIVKRYKVEGCFEIDYKEKIEEIEVQKYKNRPKRIEKISKLSLKIVRKKIEIENRIKKLGWQVYGSNAPKELVPTEKLVRHYRDEYRIEHLFNYYLNRDVGLLPVYLQKEKRIKGLIRLLSVAMRFSMLIQYEIRKELEKRKEEISGIYPGSKTRSTSRPTTPKLLRAFKGVSIVSMVVDEIKVVQMTSLKPTQKKILNLLGVEDLYEKTLKLLETRINLRGR